VSGDNWVHRSSNMTCATCQYFVPKGMAPIAGPASDLAPLGRCRRHAPTMAGFPAVYDTDWCGDHKLDSHRIEDQVKFGAAGMQAKEVDA